MLRFVTIRRLGPELRSRRCRRQQIAAGSLFALSMLTPEVRAEQSSMVRARSVLSTEAPAQAEGDRDVAVDVSGELRRDVARFRGLFDGSPVAQRAARRRQHIRKRASGTPSISRALKVFRRTQRGQFDGAIVAAATKWGLDPFLLKGLLINESRLEPERVGGRIYRGDRAVGGGARGIAQFTSSGIAAVNEVRQRRHSWGERVEAFSEADVWEPSTAIAAAAELLASYIGRFGRDGGITAYNSGPHGGRLVASQGFFRAKRGGKLSRVRGTPLQGYRFLPRVLNETNKLRKSAGLPPLPGPDAKRRRARRSRPSAQPRS